MIWTLEEASENLASWKQAYRHAAAGKSYNVEGRAVTYQDLPQIKKELQYWSDIIADLTGNRSGSGRVKRVVLVDL